MQPAPSETSPGRWDYVFWQIDSAVCGFDPDWLRLWALSASPTYARPPLIGAFFFAMNSSDIEACQQSRGPLAWYFWGLAACGRCWMTRGQRSCFRRDRNLHPSTWTLDNSCVRAVRDASQSKAWRRSPAAAGILPPEGMRFQPLNLLSDTFDIQVCPSLIPFPIAGGKVRALPPAS